jgi:hypothetical protein
MSYNIINEALRALEHLDEKQLRLLNRKVVERLKILDKAKRLKHLANFSALEKVYFLNAGEKVCGTILRLNQKTVTLLAEDGTHWNVSPSLLTKIIEV